MSWTKLLLLPVVLVFGIASVDLGVAQEKKPKEMADQDKLQGVWRVVSSESAGTKFGGADLGDMKVTFKGKIARWEQQGSDAVESAVQLAPNKTPKQIDFGAKAPAGKKPAAGLSGIGIYKFEGDKLY